MRVALLLRAMPNNKVDNKHSLVGGFNPSEKYERQSGSMKFPTQWTNKKKLIHQLVNKTTKKCQ
jgi:hypothetical protein